MNFLLEITKDDYGDKIIQTKGFLETLGFGAQMLLIGMLTVFSVLVLLFGCLTVFKLVFHGAEKKEKKPTPPPVAAQAPTAPAYVTDDAEIVAVIAAAVAMAESESGGIPFRVVSFRRK